MRPLVLLLAAACAPAGAPEAPVLPPPGTLTLTASALVPGRQATLTVDGLDPHAMVHLVRGTAQGPGPCLPAAGVCLDVRGPVYLGARRADASGTATMTFTLPASVPEGLTVWFQGVALAAPAASTPPRSAVVQAPPDLCAETQAVIDDNCVFCHEGSAPSAGFVLEDVTALVGLEARGAPLYYVDPTGSASTSYLWRKVTGTQAVVGGRGEQMPVGDQLLPADLATVRRWIDNGGQCTPGALAANPPDPVRPDALVMRRLNRAEYDRTVRDLLDTPLTPARGFPLDDAVGGFDNVASGLTLSPLHVERYEAAAEALAEDFVDRYGILEVVPIDALVQGESDDAFATTGAVSWDGGAYNLWANGTLSMVVQVATPGTYTFGTAVYARQGGTELVRMALEVDGVSLGEREVVATDRTAPELHEEQLVLDAGPHELSVRFLNDFYDDTVTPTEDRNLYVDWMHLVGPEGVSLAGVPGSSPYAAGIACEPTVEGDAVCLERLFAPLMRRAYRRPVAPDEVGALVGLLTGLMAGEGLSYREAVVGGLQAVLLSPHFLFRPELGLDGTSLPGSRPLGDHVLASRLSYFLWGSMPDAALLARADLGELQDPAVLAAEARRMLADPRAEALIEDFAGQWFWLRNIPDSAPDPAAYPGFDDGLRASFLEESHRLIRRFLLDRNDMSGLLSTTTVEVDQAVADHYGLGITVTGWQPVDVSGAHRIGLLTNGGLLAALSNPTSSNPVRRGKFLMGQILCNQPGNPPPGITSGFSPGDGQGSLREQFSAHRTDPTCAVCHDVMDPLGFSLEGYGPAGEFRTADDFGYPVDAVGTLPDGRTFDGPIGLGQTLADDPLYALCVAEKTFAYALGAELDPHLYPSVLAARDTFVDQGRVFEELVVAIVRSDAFRRRGA